MIALVLVVLSSVGVIGGLLWQHAKAVRLRRLDWTDLVAQLQPVPRGGIRAVASAYLDPKKNQIEREPGEMFELLGCAEGLHAMAVNATVILQLAGYATRWNPVEAAVVTEMIRNDACRLQKAVRAIEREMSRKLVAQRAPFRMMEAAAAYHLMTRRLLMLYQGGPAGLFYPRLAAVLQ